MAFRIYNDPPPPRAKADPDWARNIPFSGWVAVLFYVTAVALFVLGLTSPYGLGFSAYAAAMGALATGALLGALSRIIRILRDIRDHLGAG